MTEDRPDPGHAGTWVHRGSAVRRDPDVAHLVRNVAEYLSGPEPCESCPSVVVWYRPRGHPDGQPYQARIRATRHRIIPGRRAPGMPPGHVSCSASLITHDADDCLRTRADQTFSATFVRS